MNMYQGKNLYCNVKCACSMYFRMYTICAQRSNNQILLGASEKIQRDRVRERKWQTREILARGVYGGIHLCTQMKKNKTELQLTFCIHLLQFVLSQRMEFFFTQLQILLLTALNILLNNKPGLLLLSIRTRQKDVNFFY